MTQITPASVRWLNHPLKRNIYTIAYFQKKANTKIKIYFPWARQPLGHPRFSTSFYFDGGGEAELAAINHIEINELGKTSTRLEDIRKGYLAGPVETDN